MEHRNLKLSKTEKLTVWLDLCDFSFRLMKSALPPEKFKERLNKMREEHLKQDFQILKRLARLKKHD